VIKNVTPPGWPPASGYSYAVEFHGRVHVAGVTAIHPTTGATVEGGFVEQWAAVWANLAELLRAAGTTPQRVLVLRIYVTDMAAYRAAHSELGAGWSPVFGDHLPAITLVEVSSLVPEGCLIEAEAEAVVD
jgi:enamine deaminase RidA (YjgF/YER057c/UK114 family)